MPEENSGAGAPAPNQPEGQQQQSAGAQQQQPATPEPSPSPKPETSANQLIKQFVKDQGISVEQLLSEYTDLKKATQTDREKLETDRDTFRSEADTWKQKAQEANAKVAVTEAARRANAIEAGAIFPLISSKLTYDGDGTPTNVDEVVTEAKTQYPNLFPTAKGAADGGKTGQTNGYEPQPGVDRMRHAYEEKEQAAKR